MSDSASALVKNLVQRVPKLDALYQEHLKDNDELLPHVFMGDVTRFVVAAAAAGSARPKDWAEAQRVVALLEEALASKEPSVENLIAASFVENLEPDEPGFSRVVDTFGSRLKRILEKMRGA
jgi:hypothetical protein